MTTRSFFWPDTEGRRLRTRFTNINGSDHPKRVNIAWLSVFPSYDIITIRPTPQRRRRLGPQGLTFDDDGWAALIWSLGAAQRLLLIRSIWWGAVKEPRRLRCAQNGNQFVNRGSSKSGSTCQDWWWGRKTVKWDSNQAPFHCQTEE